MRAQEAAIAFTDDPVGSRCDQKPLEPYRLLRGVSNDQSRTGFQASFMWLVSLQSWQFLDTGDRCCQEVAMNPSFNLSINIRFF